MTAGERPSDGKVPPPRPVFKSRYAATEQGGLCGKAPHRVVTHPVRRPGCSENRPLRARQLCFSPLYRASLRTDGSEHPASSCGGGCLRHSRAAPSDLCKKAAGLKPAIRRRLPDSAGAHKKVLIKNDMGNCLKGWLIETPCKFEACRAFFSKLSIDFFTVIVYNTYNIFETGVQTSD